MQSGDVQILQRKQGQDFGDDTGSGNLFRVNTGPRIIYMEACSRSGQKLSLKPKIACSESGQTACERAVLLHLVSGQWQATDHRSVYLLRGVARIVQRSKRPIGGHVLGRFEPRCRIHFCPSAPRLYLYNCVQVCTGRSRYH